MNSSSTPDWELFRDLLDFDHELIESHVPEGEAYYKGLSKEALYTSYDDLVALFNHTSCQGTWVDLGAGVGLSCLLHALAFPDRKAIGVEISDARARAAIELAEKLELKNFLMLKGDLLTCEVPHGDTYFLYFPTGPVLDRILFELSKRNFTSLFVIESHGDLIPRLKKESWLVEIDQISLQSKRHMMKAIVFQKGPGRIRDEAHLVSFQSCFAFIEDDSGAIWLGDTWGLEWQVGNNYLLKEPPRTINWQQVKKICNLTELPPLWQSLVKLRPLGEFKIQLHDKILFGEIRKIFVHPGFQLELSTAERLEWNLIQKIYSGDYLCYDSHSCSFFFPPAPT